MIYQHASQGRDKEIAEGVGKLVAKKLKEGTGQEAFGHPRGTGVKPASRISRPRLRIMSLTWAFVMRAGDGSRTRVTSLEGWGSAIELHPRTPGAVGKFPPHLRASLA
jgi:hypothetical protein